jgi:hypothetical protein
MVNATQIPNVGVDGGDIQVAIDFVNDTYSALITCTNTDVTISPSEIFAPQFVRVNIPAGASGTVYALRVLYTLNSGVTETRTINIIQR